MLNIVLLNLNGGGAEKIGLLQSQFLHNLGFKVRLVTFDYREYYNVEEQEFDKLILNFTPKVSNVIKLMRFLIMNRQDKYILHTSWINIYVGLGCILLGIKFLVFEHNNLERRIAYLPTYKRLVYQRVMSFVYRRAVHVYVVSNGLKDEIISFCGKGLNPLVLYNDVSRSISRNLNSDVVGNKILLVGRNVNQKGFDRVVKLINTIETEFLVKNKVVFTFLGLGVEELMTLVVDCKKQFVRCLSFSNDIDYHYKSSKLLLFSSRYEGFGNVLLEAISFGLPVLGSHCKHGPSEILGENYPTMSAEWDESFVLQMLKRLLLDKEFYSSVGMVSHQRALAFDKIVKAQRKDFLENMVRL
jgi:glycosyltransferase involved in cell wall biosynthesis